LQFCSTKQSKLKTFKHSNIQTFKHSNIDFMAKSLKDTLKLGPRIEFKKTDKNIEATEKAVAQIHEAEIEEPKVVERIVEKIVERVVEAPPPPEVVVETEITKRVTLDIPLSLHAEIKMNTFRKGLTIKDYLLDLAKKDLGV
jgi:hypothetical protein